MADRATRSLYRVDEVAAMIRRGDVLLLAGAESALDRLPQGRWIGGTTPYLMTAEAGGITDVEHILVTRLPDVASIHRKGLVDGDGLSAFLDDGPENGFTVVILPGMSPIVQRYALESQGWPNLYRRPIIGWSSGCLYERIGVDRPKVYDGTSGIASIDHAMMLHVALPETHYAAIDMVNAYEPGDGPIVTFDRDGFETDTMRVDGVPTNLADHIREHGIDVRLPLIGDYNGASVNISMAPRSDGGVQLFAPVFPGIEYRFARSVGDLQERFAVLTQGRATDAAYACNCVNNYTLGELEGRHTGGITGPMAFGEIAYMLLNQTIVCLEIRQAD